MRFLVGLIGIPLGFLMVYYRERVKRFTGDIAFAEKYLGIGGTYTFIAILGLIVAIGSLMYMFGAFQILLENTLGRLSPGAN